MAAVVESSLCLVAVAFLWGATNPLIKKGAVGVENIRARNSVQQFLQEVKFLVLHWKYLLPFLLNQCGSVLYYFTLEKVDLSLAVPVSNSLTFVFTALAGWALGEEPADRNTYIGMLFIISGISLCVLDKAWSSEVVTS